MTASFIPTAQDHEHLQQLAEGLAQVSDAEAVYLQLPGHAAPLLVTPVVAQLLRESLKELLEGHAVSIVPSDQEVSTIEAAKLLGMSRPFLVSRFLDTGEIPYHMVGTHRRMALKDILAFREERERRMALADEMTREAQDMGLYDL